MNRTVLELLAFQTGPFIYVDCGARGEVSKPLLDVFANARYVGFEPDAEECSQLVQRAKDGYSYFPVAVGRDSETRMFYVTQNPACSSLLVPNQVFLDRFMECGPFFDVLETRRVETIALDTFLPGEGIHQVDFIELDTQGTELDILQGAENFLSSSVLGVQVEVEFSAMYQEQPLFADVDIYLRRFNFMLFDLSRYRLRRRTYPCNMRTRGQLLWGQAFYLKDYTALSRQDRKQKVIKLAIVASFLGFHDYALEIVDFLRQGGAGTLSAEESREVEGARTKYMSSLRASWLIGLMLRLDHSPLRGPFRRLGSLFAKLWDAYSFVSTKRNYFWHD